MSKQRGGLGRGLGALIPTTPVAVPASQSGTPPSPGAPIPGWQHELSPVPGARFAEIPVDAIVANPKQPRQVFDEEALAELKTSIQEVGFLQPIVVREAGPQKYELVMGERRWRAAQSLRRDTIPAIIRETRDDALLRDALLENIHRVNLNPLEEAAAYQQLLDEFGATHEELGRRIGRSRPQITNTIRLLNLPAPVQRRVAAGVLSAGHA
ncbi:MAG: ParB/RepB/Spo0J family partition protein, partial [Micromonosporaceae bacterium]|nr:ParB/RepB/Spo0J family partition protein [Micromonosporaceae bacterium]